MDEITIKLTKAEALSVKEALEDVIVNGGEFGRISRLFSAHSALKEATKVEPIKEEDLPF